MERQNLLGEPPATYLLPNEEADAALAAGEAPEKVAARIEVALTKPRPRARYMVGLDAHVVARLGPVIPPAIFDWVIAKTMRLPKPDADS